MDKINWKSPLAILTAVAVFIALAVIAGQVLKYGALVLDLAGGAVGFPGVGSKAKSIVPLTV